MKKRIVILLFPLLLLLISGCGVREKSTGDSWARIKASKKIIIGLDDTFVPMGFQDTGGQIVGFDVDLAKAVFKRYGITVDFQAIDWNMKEVELDNQTIDLIWNGYSVNAQRKKKVRFSEAYMLNDQILVSLKKENILINSDMIGKRLGAQNGSSGVDAYESEPEVLKDYIKEEPVLYAGFKEALMDLNAGRIEALLIDKVYANYYLAKMGELEKYNLIDSGFSSEDFAVGARKKDKKLVEALNQSFHELVADGTFQKIAVKWFGEDVAPENLRK